MSRNPLALLGSALVCILALTGPANRFAAAQASVLSEEEQLPPADDVPGAPRTFQDVLDRLEQAELEIQELKQGRATADAPPDEDDPAGAASDSSGLTVKFKDFEKSFKDFRDNLAKKKYPNVEAHGVVQVDSGWYGQDQTSLREWATPANPGGVLKDGVDFRRARMSLNGAIAPNMNYFVQMDYAFPGRPTFTDVWVEVTKLPLVGNIRVGQWKQPFSLEVVSSFRYTMMPERSLLFNAFTPFRHIAVGMYNYTEDERMTWAASVYRPGQDQFGGSIASSGGYAGVGRITGLPWYENDGCSYLHLGAAYNYVAPNNRFGGFRSIPEFFIGQNDSAANGSAGTSTPTVINGTPFFVNTNNFFMNHYNLVGLEALWVEGPITVQSEFMYLNATRNTGVGANFAGFYTQMGYFLTGEHRPYLKKAGALDRIKVLNDFGNNDETGYGWGGVEVAQRFSYIDLNSRDIKGGREFNYTACFNWYLNSYTKVQLEYIRANLFTNNFGQSLTSLYDIRMQWDF